MLPDGGHICIFHQVEEAQREIANTLSAKSLDFLRSRRSRQPPEGPATPIQPLPAPERQKLQSDHKDLGAYRQPKTPAGSTGESSLKSTGDQMRVHTRLTAARKIH